MQSILFLGFLAVAGYLPFNIVDEYVSGIGKWRGDPLYVSIWSVAAAYGVNGLLLTNLVVMPVFRVVSLRSEADQASMELQRKLWEFLGFVFAAGVIAALATADNFF